MIVIQKTPNPKVMWRSSDILRLLARKNYRCEFCGFDFLASPAAMLMATVDHLVPKSKGGTNSRDNRVLACCACNTVKGNAMPCGNDRETKIRTSRDIIRCRTQLVRVLQSHLAARIHD